MKLKRIFAAFALTAAMVTASAQEAEVNPWFIQGSLGASYSVGGGAGFGKMISPAGQIAFGKQFNPYLSARLAVGGWRGRYKTDNLTTGFFHYDIAVDGIWNISQTASLNPTRPVDVNLLLGVGYDRSFARPASSLLVRTGLAMDVRLNKAFDFNVECQVNGVSDRWNSKSDHGFDSFVNLLVGVTYKFGTGYSCPTCVNPEIIEVNDKVNELREEVIKEVIIRDTVEVVKEVPVRGEDRVGMSSHVVFQLAKTNVQPSQEMNVIAIADYLKTHPGSYATVIGYADKGTGSREINLRLAEERANVVADMLVNKYGVARDRLRVSSMHNQDTQQPFSVNDWNRVVIMTAYLNQ